MVSPTRLFGLSFLQHAGRQAGACGIGSDRTRGPLRSQGGSQPLILDLDLVASLDRPPPAVKVPDSDAVQDEDLSAQRAIWREAWLQA